MLNCWMHLRVIFLRQLTIYSDLGKHDSQYASLLTVVALELDQHFTKTELREAFNTLPKEGLAESAVMLARSLEGAADRSEAYWSNRVKPLIESIWPKSMKSVPVMSRLL